MMKYMLLFALIGVSTISASDFPYEYSPPQRAPRSIQPDGDLPFQYIHAVPEELIAGDLPFGQLRAARSAQPEELEGDLSFEHILDEDVYGLSRVRRSWQAGAPQFPTGNSGGSAGIDLSRQGQDTQAKINAQHSTDRYEVGGQWSKVVRGPNKAKPEWNVHGAVKW